MGHGCVAATVLSGARTRCRVNRVAEGYLGGRITGMGKPGWPGHGAGHAADVRRPRSTARTSDAGPPAERTETLAKRLPQTKAQKTRETRGAPAITGAGPLLTPPVYLRFRKRALRAWACETLFFQDPHWPIVDVYDVGRDAVRNVRSLRMPRQTTRLRRARLGAAHRGKGEARGSRRAMVLGTLQRGLRRRGSRSRSCAT